MFFEFLKLMVFVYKTVHTHYSAPVCDTLYCLHIYSLNYSMKLNKKENTLRVDLCKLVQSCKLLKFLSRKSKYFQPPSVINFTPKHYLFTLQAPYTLRIYLTSVK